MIIPIGLEDASVRRIPYVAIAILALNILVFFGVNVFGSTGDDLALAAQRDLLDYWHQHSYLKLPKEFAQTPLLEDTSAKQVKQFLSEQQADLSRTAKADPAFEQKHLDALYRSFREARDRTFWYRWGLVPARGPLQRGWISHLFVHGGWLHIIGNMFFFFFLVGPFLEDVWGRRFFPLFYLAGGLVAGFSQCLLSWSSEDPIVGASGAISACVGAFAVRFASRRVKFLYYWFGTLRGGAFFLPAWVWAIFYFGEDVLSLWFYGSGAGVAFAAHIGGFLFGLGVAVALTKFGLEEKYLQPGLDRALGVKRIDPAVTQAEEARLAGRFDEARRSYEQLLRKPSTNLDALIGLARTSIDAGRPADAVRWVERMLAAIPKNDTELAATLAAELGPRLPPDRISPRLKAKLVELQQAAAAQAPVAPDANAGPNSTDPGAVSQAALSSPAPVMAVPTSTCTSLSSPVYACAFVGRNGRNYLVASEQGQRFELAPEQVKMIASAVVETLLFRGQPLQNVIVTDLVLDWQPEVGPSIARFLSPYFGLEQLFPGQPPSLELHRAFLDELTAVSGARRLSAAPPGSDADAAINFSDIAAFERLFYPTAAR
ncbi:MAG: rhomboid family intramembrane serine protease [Deltaproteobacteria bacterium]|nr:rhomboid family intramembrane serine protease [Deltaproteobacteria bacterium]